MNNNKTKSARSVCQFFLTSVEGDFSWPVASFPVYSVTAEKLTNNMIWPLIRMLNEVSNGYIKIVYGVCDGGTWNYSFFPKKNNNNKSPWVAPNTVSGGFIHWLSDYPHMIKNYLYNPNYNLTKEGVQLSWDHVIAVAKQEHSYLSLKHVMLDGRSKMKVKYACEVLSEHTAAVMEEQDFPYSLKDTEKTREYIRMCDTLFKTINLIISVISNICKGPH